MTITYDPSGLLDALRENLNLKNDAALAQKLDVGPPTISRIRSGNLPVGASLLIRMGEETGLSIMELRDLMGDRRAKFRIGRGR